MIVSNCEFIARTGSSWLARPFAGLWALGAARWYVHLRPRWEHRRSGEPSLIEQHLHVLSACEKLVADAV